MLLRAFTLVLACSLPLLAQAQWHWIDKDGRRVFSDQAPPPDIPAKNILRQPRARTQPTAEAAAPTPAPAATPTTANAPKPAGKDPALEARRKQAEAAEAEKNKAREQEIAAARADNCKRAREAKANLDSGVRLSRINAKGEREFLDDAARAAETRRVEAVIASDCVASQ
jgi:type IV secretory pathway VirB10-like protein